MRTRGHSICMRVKFEKKRQRQNAHNGRCFQIGNRKKNEIILIIFDHCQIVSTKTEKKQKKMS